MGDSVSVVMPVRNEIAFIDQSIASILAQTHTDFELIIGDDGSTDGTYERLQEWAQRDSRIRIAGPSAGLGPSGSSNWVVGLARHPIVARMDGDDISHPDRLTAQLRVLGEHPDAVLVGTLFDRIDGRGRLIGGPQRSSLADPGSSWSPFAHGSIMFRRDAFYEAGGYRLDCRYWEDLEFCWRMASLGRLLVLTQPLYRYRNNLGSARLAHSWDDVTSAMRLFFRCADAHGDGRDYRLLLASPAGDADDLFALEAIIAVGSLRLWSGHRPRVLRHVLRQTRLPWTRRTAAILVWATAGELSPRLVRRGLRLRTYVDGLVNGGRDAERDMFEWCPPRAPVVALEEDIARIQYA